VLRLLHTLSDTRVPLAWWIRRFEHSAAAPDASSIAMRTEGALHVALIAAWIGLVG
jgi:hypothetical protein